MYGATLGVIADWVRALNLPSVLLQPRGTDAHEVSLTVRMVYRARQCRRIVAIGGGLEGYLESLQRALGATCPPIMELVHALQPHPADLHLWIDWRLARASCQLILHWAEQDRLITTSVRQGWQRTQFLFRGLEVQIRQLRPRTQGRAYIAVHDAYRPLTQLLGMHSLGSLQPDEEHPPSLQKLRQVIREGRRQRVAFVLSHQPRGVGATAARLLGVPLVLADTLERPNPERDYFLRYADLLASLEAGLDATGNPD